MNEFKLYAQRIGLVGITNALLSINVLVLLPILTKNLSIEDYSIWVQANVTLTLIPTVVLLGLPYTMVRFLAAEEINDNRKEGFYTIFIACMLMSLLACTLIFLLAEPISSILFNSNLTITRLLSVIIFVECMNYPCLSFFRTFLRMKVYSTILIVKTYLNVILVSWFVLTGQGIIGAIAALLVTSTTSFLIMAYLIIRDIGVKMPDFKHLREYLAFGVPTVPGNLSSWIINSSACYIISILLGTSFVGYYSPGYSLGNVNLMFIGPFSILLSAMLTRYYENNNIKDIKLILNYSSKYFLALAIPSTFGLSLLSKPLLMILSPAEIANNGYLITPFVALSAMIYGLYTFFAEIVSVKKRTDITGTIWIMAAILNLVLNFTFIPRLGILGAAITILITYTFALLLSIYYSSRYIPLKMNTGFIAKSIFAASLMSLLIIFANPSGIIEILMVIAVCAIFYTILLLILRAFSKEELDFIKKAIKIPKMDG